MKILTFILGALLLVGGIYCLFTPIQTYAALSWLIGLSMVVDGVGGIIMWNDWRKQGLASGWMLAGAIISIVLGLFLLGSYAARFAVDVFIAYLIAFWLVCGGIARIVSAISARNFEKQMGASVGQVNWVALLVIGIITTILGVLCLFNPVSIAIGIGVMLGLCIISVGAGVIACAARM